MKRVLKFFLATGLLILFAYICIIAYYKFKQPLKLTSTTTIYDKKAILDKPNNDWYFYYDIYNPSRFEIKIKDIQINARDSLIKSIRILDTTNNSKDGFKEINNNNPFILKQKSEATILVIVNINGLNAKFDNFVVDYELLGIHFKKNFEISLFSEYENVNVQNEKLYPQKVIDKLNYSNNVLIAAKDVDKVKELNENEKIELIDSIQKSTDDNSLLYLFNAESVKLEGSENKFSDGDYTHIKENIIRFFISDIESEKEIKDSNPQETLTLKFKINGKIYDVKIYNDGFIYIGKFYKKEGVKKELEAMLQAGK